jgi:hypothetical protein
MYFSIIVCVRVNNQVINCPWSRTIFSSQFRTGRLSRSVFSSQFRIGQPSRITKLSSEEDILLLLYRDTSRIHSLYRWLGDHPSIIVATPMSLHLYYMVSHYTLVSDYLLHLHTISIYLLCIYFILYPEITINDHKSHQNRNDKLPMSALSFFILFVTIYGLLDILMIWYYCNLSNKHILCYYLYIHHPNIIHSCIPIIFIKYQLKSENSYFCSIGMVSHYWYSGHSYVLWFILCITMLVLCISFIFTSI